MLRYIGDGVKEGVGGDYLTKFGEVVPGASFM